jgi:hypothetical protein
MIRHRFLTDDEAKIQTMLGRAAGLPMYRKQTRKMGTASVHDWVSLLLPLFCAVYQDFIGLQDLMPRVRIY